MAITLPDILVGLPVGHTTIDRAPGPNSYLDDSRTLIPGADVHGSVTDIDRTVVVSAARGDCLNLVGHGDQGLVFAGAGGSPGADDQYLSTDNCATWQRLLGKLPGRFSEVRLWACNTGGGDEGAALLSLLAEHLRAKVTASTGIVYCNVRARGSAVSGNYSLQGGSSWQCAKPGYHPGKIDPPDPYTAVFPPYIKVKQAKALANVDPRTVVSLWVFLGTDTSVQPLLRTGENASLPELLALIDFANPFTPPGVPGARVTATIVMRFATGEPRTFRVLNNVLVQDVSSDSSRDTYYYTAWRSFGDQIRRPR